MKKYSFLFLIVGLVFLFLFMRNVLLPLVYDVVKSDAFLVDTKDQGSVIPKTSKMTDLAFMQCNNYIKTELGSDYSVSFPKKPINSWGLGNYQYLINAEITTTNSNNASKQKYVCRITYENGENQEGVVDPENWSIEGIDGVEGL